MVNHKPNTSCGNVERFLGGSTLGDALKPLSCPDAEPMSLIHKVLSVAQDWSQGSQFGDVLQAALALFEDSDNDDEDKSKIIEPEGTVRN